MIIFPSFPTEKLLFLGVVFGEITRSLPCPQRDLWVHPTVDGSLSLLSRVYGSCNNSSSASTGRRIPSPRGSAVGLRAPVARKPIKTCTDTQEVILQNNRMNTEKDQQLWGHVWRCHLHFLLFICVCCHPSWVLPVVHQKQYCPNWFTGTSNMKNIKEKKDFLISETL